MNWVDLIILGLLAFFTFEGFRKSFFAESLDFLSFLIAFFLSTHFYIFISKFLSANFQIPSSIANVLGFVISWFLIETIFFLLIRFVYYNSKKLFIMHGERGSGIISKVEKSLNYFSFIPAFMRGLVFIAIVLVTVATFPIQPIVKAAVQDSMLGSRILSQAQRLEVPLKNIFGGISQDTLTVLTVKPKSNESVDLGFKTTEFQPNPKLELEMISLVNKERANRGLKVLTYNEDLRNLGRLHSADMFTRGYFSHYSPEGKSVADRAAESNVGYLVIGENLAYAPDLKLAHDGLMNSPGHKANVLSPDFSKIGVGIEDGGVYGLMITQVFSN